MSILIFILVILVVRFSNSVAEKAGESIEFSNLNYSRSLLDTLLTLGINTNKVKKHFHAISD